SDNQDLLISTGRAVGRREPVSVGAVVNHGTSHIPLEACPQQLLDLSADTDHLACLAIDLYRYLATPLRAASGKKARIEHIETMQGDDVRNLQMARQQHGGVPAGQRSVGVDEVDPVFLMQVPHSREQPLREKSASAGQTQVSGNLRIANPFGRR